MLIAALTMFAVILYVIELLTSRPIFDLISGNINYVISFPFLLLSIIVNYGIVIALNRPGARKLKLPVRVVTEGVSAILVAGVIVIVGNLPFMDDMAGYVNSSSYWKSVAFATVINIFILASLEFFIQTVTNRRLQNENAVLQYRQLKSQINPHFLFNSLNVLVCLINKDSDLAVKYTKELSAVYRYVLAQDRLDTVTLREEMEFISSYIDILKTRFGEGLEVRLDIRHSDLCRSLPPMSLQLLIENAVKHNAVSVEEPLTISIDTDGTCLKVSNNLIPRLSRGEGNGVGLENLSRKYSILSGDEISVYKDEGEFSVKLPLL